MLASRASIVVYKVKLLDGLKAKNQEKGIMKVISNGNGAYQKHDWNDWVLGINKAYGEKWDSREVQDHFYRRVVVMPAVLEQINDPLIPNTVVDFGCGDGYFTELIMAGIKKRNRRGKRSLVVDREIFLIDRSRKQLDRAEKRSYPGLFSAIESDLCNGNWEGQIHNGGEILGPLAAFSIFTLQEMPDIYSFLPRVRALLQNSSLPGSSSFIAVVVHPEYAEFLVDNEKMSVVQRSIHTHPQFSWAGEYPITVKAGGRKKETIFRPYFHRSIFDYKLAAEHCGLVLSEYQPLSLPNSTQAVRAFGDTVYGRSIIGMDSSALLTFHLA